MINFKLTLGLYNYSILALIILSLLSAHVLEIFFNIKPCLLCYYQRYLYFFFIPILILNIRLQKKYLIFIGLALSLALSLIHALVELKVIDMDSFCQPTLSYDQLNLNNPEDFLKKLNNSQVKCSEVTFSILGLSLAKINVILMLFLLFVGIKFIDKEKK